MKDLLLPYAYDSTGNLVHINDARKDDSYKCPECGQPLILNISKIPQGQKYHRRSHFSHPKGSPDNHCTESFLHKLFKERAAECIRKKISENEKEFWFTWQCDQCNEEHCGDMFKKARSVRLEYDLKVCKPDIALFNADGQVVIVIEVVVTHKPTPEAMAYYDEHKIGCLQIYVSDFEDCKHVEEKLKRPNSVNICPTPKCEKCGKKKHKAKMVIVNTNCGKCLNNMKAAIIMIKGNPHYQIYSPSNFTKEEIQLANVNGANIKKKYDEKMNNAYYANVCECCDTFISKDIIDNYYNYPHDREIDLSYKCYDCIKLDTPNKASTTDEIKKNEKSMYNNERTCPKCQCELIVKQGPYGKFYACGNFPNCRYTEKIILKD